MPALVAVFRRTASRQCKPRRIMTVGVENQDVAETLQHEEVVQPQEQTTPQETTDVKENSKEYNFRQLERAKSDLEKQNQELQQRLYEIERRSQKSYEEPQEDSNIGPDDLVEGKHLQREIKRLESQLAAYSAVSVESRLKSQYQDFDKVVNKENIERLKQEEPELASTLFANQDLYSKGIAAYKLLKNLNYYKEDPYTMEKDRAKANLSKPKSSSQAGGQLGQTPLHAANAYQQGLTPELRQQLLKEMEEARRGY